VKKVLLAGEGRTEIGGEPGWGKSQRARIPAAPGVLEAIARKATSGRPGLSLLPVNAVIQTHHPARDALYSSLHTCSATLPLPVSTRVTTVA